MSETSPAEKNVMRYPDVQDFPSVLGTLTPEQRWMLSAILHHELNTCVAPFPSLLAAYSSPSDSLLRACLTEALRIVKTLTTCLRQAEEKGDGRTPDGTVLS